MPFADLADFATRVDPRIVNRRTLETLVNAGALDGLVPKREQAFAACRYLIEELKTRATFWKQEDTGAGRRWVSPG